MVRRWNPCLAVAAVLVAAAGFSTLAVAPAEALSCSGAAQSKRMTFAERHAWVARCEADLRTSCERRADRRTLIGERREKFIAACVRDVLNR